MSGAHIIYGFHAVLSRMRQNARSIQELAIDKDRVDPRMKDLLSLAQENNVRVMQIDRARLDGMAAHGRHQGVVAKVVAHADAETQEMPRMKQP